MQRNDDNTGQLSTTDKQREKEAMRALLTYAKELDEIISREVLPALREIGHPVSGRVHSLRQEIRLQAMVVGGVL
ncbi:MAG: hypothetical protein JKY58_12425 [Pseudomonas sp.]|nr:hypothetical protein [Pseudomonas sp.]